MAQTKKQIITAIANAFKSGRNAAEVKDMYFVMRMENDMPATVLGGDISISLKDTEREMLGNGIIPDKDISIGYHQPSFFYHKFQTAYLEVKLNPTCTVIVDALKNVRRISVKGNCNYSTTLHHQSAGELAMWLISLKEKVETYNEDWNEIQKNALKRQKSSHLAFVAIKAYITESLIDYPDVKFDVIEQKMRARINLKMPKCRVHVWINAYWGSYKNTLPGQIEEAKVLADAFRQVELKEFSLRSR